MAEYLKPAERSSLLDEVLDKVGYDPAVRALFLSDVHKQFKNQLPLYNNPRMQLDSDLTKLNDTPMLVDGTIPFLDWLNKAEQYFKVHPASIALVHNAMQKVSGSAVKNSNIGAVNITDTTVKNIITEKIIHQNDMVSYSFLEAGYNAGQSVMMISVPRYDNGNKKQLLGQDINFAGTGWLLTKQLLITNHHVINARSENEPDATETDFKLQGKNSSVTFDFNADNMVGQKFQVQSIEAWNKDLDFSVLRLKDAVQRDRLRIFPEEITVDSNRPQPVNIIQHPNGHSKKVALRNNHIYETNYPKVHYFTDTDKGSSGSPVFDDNWRVVALHRGSMLVQGLSYQGKTSGWVNEGIQLKAILGFLSANHRELFNEIINS